VAHDQLGVQGSAASPGGSGQRPAGGASAGTGYTAVLRNPHFLLIWLAQILSQTAQNIVNFALVVEVERLTHSSTNVSWVIVAFSLPALLLGPSAGVFVDRTSKRAVLLWTNFLRAALMLGFVLIPPSLQTFYAVTFVASAISQFFLPAEGAIIPLLVKRHELITANSLFSLTFTGAQVAGFVILGPSLYKLFGPSALFIAVIVMYMLAAVCVAAIPRRRERLESGVLAAARRAVHVAHVWGDMAEAGRFLRAAGGVSLAIFHLTLATGLLMTLATLGPGFVARVLGLGAEDVGYILAPAGVGMLGATALLGQFAVHTDRRRLAGVGLLAMALSLALLALLGNVSAAAQATIGTLGYLALVCALTFSLGVEFALVTIPAQSVVSEATDEALRGRVFALLFMLTGSVSAIPTVAIGVLADNLGIWQMFLALAAIVGAFGLASLRPRVASAQPA
jgi:MFS family permease